MRRILTMTVMTLGLLGGAAMADSGPGRGGRANVTDHRDDRGAQRGTEQRVTDHRDNDRRDTDRRDTDRRDTDRRDNDRRDNDRRDTDRRDNDRRDNDRRGNERGYASRANVVWVAGAWQWGRGTGWRWIPGHYMRR